MARAVRAPSGNGGRRRSRNRRRDRCGPAGVSMTKAAHSALLRSSRSARRPVPHRRERDRNARSELDAIVPIVGLDADRRVVVAHDRVVAERRDDARPMRGRESRQRRDIEMVVVAMRHQHGIDRRQRVERDAGIVHPLRPGEANGEARSDHNGSVRMFRPAVCSRNRRVADERDTPCRPVDAPRRPVGIRARRPCRPFGLAAAGVPAQQVASAVRRRAVRIEKPRRRRSDPDTGPRSSAPPRSECRERQVPRPRRR